MEQILADEIAANPALASAGGIKSPNSFVAGRLATPSARHGGCGPDAEPWHGDDPLEQIPARTSVFEQLAGQIRQVSSGPACAVALALLARLDPRGYLPCEPSRLAAELVLPLETVRAGVRVLHDLEPAGIGARDLRECLLLQCRALEAEDESLRDAGLILQHAWDDFLHQRWNLVGRKTRLPRTAVRSAVLALRRIANPRPLETLEPVEDLRAEIQPAREPDLVIFRAISQGRAVFRLEIPGEDRAFVKISESFARQRFSAGEVCASDRAWMRSQSERANQVLQALRQRWDTLRRLGEYLLAHQKAFMEHGALHLKPMTRQEVSQALGLHPSTICRAVLDKTIQLPDGSCRPLSDFFDTALPVKERISQILAQAPHRLSHREICERLGEEGIQVARRTVAKYSQGAKPPSPRPAARNPQSYSRFSTSTPA